MDYADRRRPDSAIVGAELNQGQTLIINYKARCLRLSLPKIPESHRQAFATAPRLTAATLADGNQTLRLRAEASRGSKASIATRVAPSACCALRWITLTAAAPMPP